MFAHKLVAITDRFSRYTSLAGRDLYDIHHFFLTNQSYLGKVIEERLHLSVGKYFDQLVVFIQKYFTQEIIDQDINSLLSSEKYRQIRKIILSETISFLQSEAQSLARCK